MKDSWWKYALVALAAVAWWFVQSEVNDFKIQNKMQWAEAAKTKECFLMELGKTKERLAHLEGFHEAERLYKK